MTRNDVEALAGALEWNRATPPVPVWGNDTPAQLVLRGYDHAIEVVAMVLTQRRTVIGFDVEAFIKSCGVTK